MKGRVFFKNYIKPFIQKTFSTYWGDIDSCWQTRSQLKREHGIEFDTPKLLQLLQRMMIATTSENDWVLDPFLGSGATMCACFYLNRKCLGIESSKVVFKMAKKKRFDDIRLK